MSSKRTRTRTPLFFATLLVTLQAASVVFAQALVVVEVRTAGGAPTDGVITLSSRDSGQSYSCSARQGSCQIEGVPAGMYSAVLRPAQGHAPPPRQVMIPPSGTVTLRISTH